MKVLPFIVFRSPLQPAHSIVLALTLLNGGALAQSHSSSAKSSEQTALQRGQEALRKGDLEQSRAELERAVRLAPNDAAAQSALGWVLALQGQSDVAIEHLRAAIEAKPAFVEARLTFASVLSQQGKAEETEQELQGPSSWIPDLQRLICQRE